MRCNDSRIELLTIQLIIEIYFRKYHVHINLYILLSFIVQHCRVQTAAVTTV